MPGFWEYPSLKQILKKNYGRENVGKKECEISEEEGWDGGGCS